MNEKILQSNLSKNLRDHGYDLIGGPIRSYKLMQLWLKVPANPIELYYAHLSHAFTAKHPLEVHENKALKVSSRYKNEYKFNVGISLLEPLLSAFGLNNLSLETLISAGKSISISYEGSSSEELVMGSLTRYLHGADYLHPNPSLFAHSNKDQLILISGLLWARNLVITIETEKAVSPSLILKLDKKADGKLNTFKKSDTSLKLVSEGKMPFPIAVKANRLHFDKGHFKGSNLVTDSRSLF